MEKCSETVYGSQYFKYYRREKPVAPVAFLEELRGKGWSFHKVFMQRDAEMDMQFDIGNYTLEELKQAEASLACGPACKFTLEANLNSHAVEIHFSDDSEVVYMITTEPDFELE